MQGLDVRGTPGLFYFLISTFSLYSMHKAQNRDRFKTKILIYVFIHSQLLRLIDESQLDLKKKKKVCIEHICLFLFFESIHMWWFACLLCVRRGDVPVDCGAFSFSKWSVLVQLERVVNYISTLLPPGSGLSLHLSCLRVINSYCFINTPV